MTPPEVFRWILDVQHEWPCSEPIKPGRDAAPRWALEEDTKYALGLLPVHERDKVLRFYHIRDAKLSLGSQLLKHCAIVRTRNIPWSETTVGNDQNRKPCYVSSDGDQKQMEFNVSHHGSLVALAGCADPNIQVGIDVVQVEACKDIPKVRREGWPSWVNTYEAVFSAREVQDIVTYEPLESVSDEDLLKAKIRHFYAHWCLKEAYVKMTGEALMAPWLKDMEFRNVRVPRPATDLSSGERDDAWGEVCSDVEVWRHGLKLTDVKMDLQAFRGDYMVGTAISSRSASLLPYKVLDLQGDVYSATGAG
ncbi:MAG: hypothetical protein LQ338_001281 [Usnochroma carphineum]|nr:MAG: hypothetical protein LQ338_001281 [Usnochroma carphineum]